MAKYYMIIKKTLYGDEVIGYTDELNVKAYNDFVSTHPAEYAFEFEEINNTDNLIGLVFAEYNDEDINESFFDWEEA